MLSVIVPVYNAEKYLNKCVDSILNQTYQDIEIILVNDGSKDNSKEICDQYAMNRSNVKVLNKANGGSTSAYIAGIELSTGDFVTFVDSDDWIENDMYQKLMQHFNDDINLVFCKHNMVFCDAGKEDEGRIGEIDFGIKEGEYDREDIDIFFIKPNQKCVSQSRCNKIYRKSDMMSIVPLLDSNIVYAEDVLLNYIFFMDKFSKGYYVDEALYHYRFNNKSVSTNFNRKKFDDLNNIYSRLKAFDEKNEFELTINSMYAEFILRATKLVATSAINNKRVELMKEIVNHENFKRSKKNCDWQCYNFKQKLKKFLLCKKLVKTYIMVYNRVAR